MVFTADEGMRGGKVIPLKKMVDNALEGCECVRKVYVYKRTGADVPMNTERDVVLDEVSRKYTNYNECDVNMIIIMYVQTFTLLLLNTCMCMY